MTDSYVSQCTDVLEAQGGNIIMGGLTYDFNTGSNRLSIVGADSLGNQIWQKNYGSAQFEYLDNALCTRSLIRYNNAFYFYSGVRDSNIFLSVLIKFNFTGDTLWQHQFREPSASLFIDDVTKSTDNGFLLSGLLQNQASGDVSVVIIKTDAIGNELWRKKLNKLAPNIQDGRSILQDSLSKKIIITGYQALGNTGVYSYYPTIFVCDSLGNELQRYSVEKLCGGIFSDLVQTNDGNFVAAGMINQCSTLGGFDRTRSYALKFSINDLTIPIWERQFDTLSLYNSFNTINELGNGNLILSGMLDTMSNKGAIEKGMLRLIKLDKNGNTIWHNFYSKGEDPKNSKRARSLNVTRDGSYLIASDLFMATNPRPFNITKIDSTGCDSTTNYCHRFQNNEPLDAASSDFEIFPNPSNGKLNFHLPYAILRDNANVKIVINDMMGKQVYGITISQTQTDFDLSFLAAGVYVFSTYRNERKIYNNKLIMNYR